MRRVRLIVAIVGGVLGLTLGACGTYFLGVIYGVHSVYHRQYEQERDLVIPMLSANPAFAHVTVHEYSGGGVALVGRVESAAELTQLRTEVTRLIGEVRVKGALSAVSIE